MATHTLTPLVHHLHSVASRPSERSDEELLHAFTSRRDEAAFAVIVRRHGALVLGVCRRALRDHHDAEDAFQATFLVLARNAGSIRKGQSLASWLHGVSYRISLKARQQASRRRQQQSGDASDRRAGSPEEELTWAEVRSILDEEVARLPEHYREPFVLCCLEGAPRAEASSRLGIKDGTLSSRLAEGRRRLQKALARRGVALSLPIVPPAVPAGLTRMAIRIAAGEVPGTGVPAAVAALARGTTAPVTWGKAALAAALALSLVAFGAGAGLQPRSPQGAAAAASEKPKPASEAPAEVKGRVLDPAGKPAADAAVSIFRGADPAGKPTLLGTTGDDGRFAFRLPPGASGGDVKVIATAKGLAAGWADLTPDKELSLQLAEDGVVEGRVLSLEGRPLAGVTAEVLWVGVSSRDTLAGWIAAFVGANKKGYWTHETGLRIIRPAALGLPRTVTTGKNGTFRVDGVGRGRVATVVLKSERTVAARVQVVAGDGPGEGWVKGDYGLYATGFSILLAPSKPIVGTVRDRKTGKPVAGLRVSGNSSHVMAKTDEKGEFRLVGQRKQSNYMIAVGGRKGVPYIDYTRHEIADTPGLDPVRVDIEVERGVEVSGKVIDRDTGKPVRGTVSYFLPTDNAHAKDYTTLGGAKFIISDWGKIAEDGSFTVLGIPGRGVLVVQARDSTRYARIDTHQMLTKRKVNSFPVAATHGLCDVEVDQADPKSLRYTIALEPARTRTLRLVDAEGKPIVGASAVGQTDGEKPRQLATSELPVAGLRADRKRAVVALHEGRKLGAVAAVGGDGEAAIEVKLRPLGAITGRLVDADGTPLPGRTVRLYLWLDPKRYENLPTEHRVRLAFSLDSGSWSEFTMREATTDKDGRFTVTGLIAGERYDLTGGEGRLREPVQVSHLATGYRAEPGQSKDVGDVKPAKRR